MFFKNILNVPNVKARFLQDQLGLLRDIVKAYVIRLPFQNVTSFGQYKPLDRPLPGLDKVISANITGVGGLCAHNNVFLKYQLECLGYNAKQISGTFVRTGIEGSHSLITIQIPMHLSKENPKRDRTFLVDVGCGIPLAEPIPLDELPFKGRAGGLNFRYERLDDNTIQRINECGDAIVGKKPPDFKSPQNYKIYLKPIEYRDIRGPSAAVYTNVRSVFLHQGLYCFRYLDIQKDDFKIVCIRGTEVTFITKETRDSIVLKSYQDVKPYLLEYFPMIDKTEIDLTIANFSTPFEECIKQSKNYKPQSSSS